MKFNIMAGDNSIPLNSQNSFMTFQENIHPYSLDISFMLT